MSKLIVGSLLSTREIVSKVSIALIILIAIFQAMIEKNYNEMHAHSLANLNDSTEN